MLTNNSSWMCCQIGAREHYAVPRALHQKGRLIGLLTDAWLAPDVRLNYLPIVSMHKLRQRFHPELADASIHKFIASLLLFEMQQRLACATGWQRTMARNAWFQHHVVNVLSTVSKELDGEITLFAYSYAALEIFRFAKQRGWRTVLGQIDPGPTEEKIVAQEHGHRPTYQATWQPAPPTYWQLWQEECTLADTIVVNSSWSRKALQQVNIPKEKTKVIPLAYKAPAHAKNFVRKYPSAFTSKRPLRVLFLGQIILRKGIAAVLEAAEILHGQPVEFWLVGIEGIAKPQFTENLNNVQWIGSVSRSETASYYRNADVFLFPTLSDGFGITQLEAQAWKLPLIVSPFCGEVVKHNVNGLQLAEVSGQSVAEALQFCLAAPAKLQHFSDQSVDLSQFSLEQLQNQLQSLP